MSLRLTCALLLIVIATPTFAAPIPAPIEDMLRAASPTDRKVVAKVAKATATDSVTEIDALVAALSAAETAEKQAALATQGFWDGWSGEGSLGGSFSTGNTEETGVSAGLALEKRGVDWEHDLSFAADYLRTDGATRRERFYAGYTGRYDLSGDFFFAFGLLSFERDRFSGIDYRFTESLGAGYRLYDTDRFKWTIEGGPALRQTSFTDGTDENKVDLLGRTDIDWQISDSFTLTERAGFVLSRGNSSYFAKTAATATVLGDLKARLSLDVLHETEPPAGRVKTDTITRASLVYDF
ncbi:MAG: DUF481 domain-containing protein [Pacificimonas sp.]